MVRARIDRTIRRAAIVEQAILAIGERGYYGFTIPELAKRCGLTNAGLLYHFPSKDHLLVAVLREIEEREIEVLLPLVEFALEAIGTADGPRASFQLLRTMAVRAANSPELVRLFAELQVESLNREHPASDWWRRRDAMMLAFFEQILAAHVSDVASSALELAAMLDGLFVRWMRADQSFDIVGEYERAVVKIVPAFAETATSGSRAAKI